MMHFPNFGPLGTKTKAGTNHINMDNLRGYLRDISCNLRWYQKMNVELNYKYSQARGPCNLCRDLDRKAHSLESRRLP